MEAEPRRPKGRDSDISVLNAAIDTLSLAREFSDIAGAVFGPVNATLEMIRVNLLLVFR